MGPETIHYKMEMLHLGESTSRNKGHQYVALAGGPDSMFPTTVALVIETT